MITASKPVLWLLVLLPGLLHAGDAGSTNAYESIVHRNTFVTGAPAAEGNVSRAVSLSIITANGINTMAGISQVMFKVSSAGKETAGHTLALGVGEEQEGIKVVAIDQDSRTITFDNHGTIQKIALEKAVQSTYVPTLSSSSGSAAISPLKTVSSPLPPLPASPAAQNGLAVVIMGNSHNHPAGLHFNGVAANNAGPNNAGFQPRMMPIAGTIQPPPNATPPQAAPSTGPVASSLVAPQQPLTVPNQPGPSQVSIGADEEMISAGTTTSRRSPPSQPTGVSP